jgi:hypothetical protein
MKTSIDIYIYIYREREREREYMSTSCWEEPHPGGIEPLR